MSRINSHYLRKLHLEISIMKVNKRIESTWVSYITIVSSNPQSSPSNLLNSCALDFALLPFLALSYYIPLSSAPCVTPFWCNSRSLYIIPPLSVPVSHSLLSLRSYSLPLIFLCVILFPSLPPSLLPSPYFGDHYYNSGGGPSEYY